MRTRVRLMLHSILCLALVSLCFLPLGFQQVAHAAVPTSVVLNEVRCDDVKPDFIEIYNGSVSSVSLDGWFIGDHLGDLTNDYHVKTLGPLTLGPKKYTRIYRGTRSMDFRFNITCGDDDIKLANINGGTINIVDSVEIPPIAAGFSWGRTPTARNGWSATTPTPGTANRSATAGSNYDPSDWIFDPQIVKRLDLTLPNATLVAFQNGNPGNVYQPATFQMKNLTNPPATNTPLQVGIRLKNGYGSYRPFGSLSNPNKSSFKIKFDTKVAGQRFFGLNKLTLNNMVQDPSMVHEWASYSLFRAMGIPSPRVGYTSVYINNVYWGFYLTLEPYDDVSLSWHYPSTQHLYEGLWTDRPSDLSPGRATIAYQIDEGSTTDRKDLETLINVLNANPISSTTVRKYLNLEEVVTHMAVEQFLNHWDGYTSTQWWTPNNYYLHSSRSGFFELLPWGTDQTWGGNAADFSQAIGTLFKKCYADDYCKSLYFKALAQVSQVANSLEISGGISAIVSVQKEGMTADGVRGNPYSTIVSASKDVTTHLKNATVQVASFLKENAKADIRWVPPTSLKAGTRLASSFFNAYSDVAGSFKYSVAVGRLLAKGTLKVTITFTPSDSVNFTATSQTYNIPVVS